MLFRLPKSWPVGADCRFSRRKRSMTARDGALAFPRSGFIPRGRRDAVFILGSSIRIFSASAGRTGTKEKSQGQSEDGEDEFFHVWDQ